MEQTILLVIQVISALCLIGLVLVQQGKGADAGASFGGGASQTVFGSSGSGNFLTRTTSILATVFFVTSLLLAYFTKQNIESAASVDIFESVTVDSELPVMGSDDALEHDLPGGAVEVAVEEKQIKETVEPEATIEDNAVPQSQ